MRTTPPSTDTIRIAIGGVPSGSVSVPVLIRTLAADGDASSITALAPSTEALPLAPALGGVLEDFFTVKICSVGSAVLIESSSLTEIRKTLSAVVLEVMDKLARAAFTSAVKPRRLS